MNYYHPNKFNEEFLAIDWLSKKFFKLIDADTFYTILTRILLEQSFIFICEDIQNLTTLVLGFSFLIRPFNWPFILIPNLPLDLLSMVESPVPFLLGILGDEEDKNFTNFKQSFINNPNISANVVIYITSTNKLELYLKEKINSEEPDLNGLKTIVKSNLSNLMYANNTKMTEEYDTYCETLYKNIFETLKHELADQIEKQMRMNVTLSQHITSQNTLELSNINCRLGANIGQNLHHTTGHNHSHNTSDFSYINSTSSIKFNFIESIATRDQPFAILFSQTQLFQSYCEEIRKKESEEFDYI